jgi:hypothetical protein
MQPYDLSPELIGWVDQHKKEIRNKLQTELLKLERGREQFMKRIIKAPHFLSKAWSELIQVLEEQKAPPSVVSEAKEVASVLSADLKDKAFSDGEQAELSALVQPLESAKSDPEKLSIVQEAIRQGKLSKRLADRIVRLVPNKESYQRAQDSASSQSRMAMMSFSWGACGFCGALGFVEGGPLGGAVACLFCAALAE